jgi:hypothetical protein
LSLKLPKPPKYTFKADTNITTECGIDAGGDLTVEDTGDSCNHVIETHLDLKIPKPPKYTFKTTMSLETLCGLSSAIGSMSIEENGDLCDRSITTHLNLKIPKPPKYTFSTNLNIETICGLSSAFGSFSLLESSFLDIIPPPKGGGMVDGGTEECGNHVTANLNLKIPKPPEVIFETSVNAYKTCRIVNGESSAFCAFWLSSSFSDCKKKVKAHLNLEIPCIMFDITGGSASKSIGISYNCANSKPEGTVNLGIEFDSCCNIKVDPKIKLKIPKPKEFVFKQPVYNIRKVCKLDGLGGPSATGTTSFWLEEKSDPENCKTEVIPHLNIDIPCIMFDLITDKQDVIFKDPDYCDAVPKGDITLKYEKTEDCCKYKITPVVNLQLPKPIKYEFQHDASVEFKCGITPSIKFTHESTTGDDCNKTIKYKLEAKLPEIPTYTYELKPQIVVDNHYEIEKNSTTVIVDDEESCGKKIVTELTIKVPHVANLRINCAGKDKADEFEFDELNPDEDASNVIILGGLGGSGHLDLGESEDSFGFVTSLCPTLTLNLPCPLDKLAMSGDSKGSGGYYIDVKQMAASDSGCAAKFGIHLKKENVYTGTIKFLTGIIFNGQSFTPKVGHISFKDGLCTSFSGDASPTIQIKVAKHTNKCCGDDEGNNDDGGDAPEGGDDGWW